MSSKYERELRQVLAGLTKGVDAIIKSCSEIEKAKMKLIEKRPFLVVRAAGSGIEGSGDLLALREICVFLSKLNPQKKRNCTSLEERWNSIIHWFMRAIGRV